MAKLIAIADDLTGAADCAAPCVAYGMTARVALHSGPHPDLHSHWPEAEVISIDANTRGGTAEDAAQATADLVKLSLFNSPDAVLFKKVDSTLRGNLATELAATLRAFRESSTSHSYAMILTPALPAQGRTTIGGRQMVHGRPLEETNLWKCGPLMPRSNIAEMLRDSRLSSHLLDLATLRSQKLEARIAEFAHTTDVLICDAETDDDLARIASAAIQSELSLWAGSAGLAAQFPSAVGLLKQPARPQGDFRNGPTLIVVGSATSTSLDQANQLAAQPEVVTIRVTLNAGREIGKAAAEISVALRLGRDTLVVLEAAHGCEAQMFAKSVSETVRPSAGLVGGLVVTGGETARAILDALGIHRLLLLEEVMPGLPFSVAEGWAHPLPVITKAGAFGASDALIRCRDFLRNLDRKPIASHR